MSGGGGASSANTEPSKVLSLQVSQSAYGTARTVVWGTCRVPSNMLGYYDFTPRRVEKEATAGGGKGGGGSPPPSISYEYSAAFALAVGAGPIVDVPRVWVDKEAKTLDELEFTLHTGALGQSPWAYLTAHHPSEAVGYSGIAYVSCDYYDLGDEPSSPQLNFEVIGRLATRPDGDAEAADVVVDMLTDPVEGLGLDEALIDVVDFRVWCEANDYSISMAADSQQGARDWLQQILDATMCSVIDDAEKIRIIPLGDEVVGDWDPDTTPVYDITADDLLADPLLRRKQPGDLDNKVVLTYTSRANDYKSIPVTARDVTHINLYGEREKSKTVSCITRADMASAVAETIKNRGLYQLAEVELRLDERFILLQPLDIITLTFEPHGLTLFPLRVTEITISADGEVNVTAEEWPAGVASPAIIQTQAASGYVPNYNVVPGNASAPVIFEPPMSLAGQPQLWLATSGGANWGGCEVYVSLDDATYSRVGVIGSASRHGITTATYPLASDPDNTNTLAVDVSVSGAQLLPVTQAVRDLYESLCWVGNAAGGELVAYQGATLTGVGRYNLTNLRRGAYGSQVIAHASGQQFVRLDGRHFAYNYNTDLIGETLYIKLRSFNKFGANAQDLSTITPTLYQIKGAPLGVVSGLVLESAFSGLVFAAKWDAYPGAQSYDLELWSGGSLRKSLNTVDTRFSATIEQLVSWGASRSVELRVVAVAFNGQSTDPAVLIASKPQCAAPTVALQDTSSSLIVTASQSADAAYKATRICISQTSGFDPTAVTPYYDGPQTSYPSGTIANGAWYVRVTQYDRFGADSLNWTSELTLTVSETAKGISRVGNASSIVGSPSSPPPGGNGYWSVYDEATGKMFNWDFAAGVYTSAVSATDIAGKIANSQINDTLIGRIALVDADTSVVGSVAKRLADQALALGADITDVQTLLEDADEALATSISLLTAGVAGAFDAGAMWYFDSGAEGWTLANATGGVVTGWLQVLGSASDPQAISPAISVSGSAYPVVRARVRRLAGSGWDAQCFYATAGHSFDSGYYKALSMPTELGTVGGIAILEWDMSALDSGGTDWLTNTITGIRIDLGVDGSDDFEIDYVGIGRNAPGASFAGLASEISARVSQNDARVIDISNMTARLNSGGDIKEAIVSVTSTADVIASNLSATHSVVLSAGGAVSGLKLFNDGTVSAMRITGDALLVSPGNLVLDDGFYDPSWWSNGAASVWPTGYTPNNNTTDEQPLRFLRITPSSPLNWTSKKVTCVPGDAYRVTLRIYRSADFSGNLFIGQHVPLVAWAMPGTMVYDWHDGRLSNASGLGQWVTYTGIWTTGAGVAFLQSRLDADIATGYCEIYLECVKASGVSMVVDGSITAAKVATAAITTDKLQAASVTADKVSVASLSAISAYLGSIISATIELVGSGVNYLRTASKWLSDGVNGFILMANGTTGDYFQEFRAASGLALVLQQMAGGPAYGALYKLVVRDGSGVDQVVIDPATGAYKFRGHIDALTGSFAGNITSAATISGASGSFGTVTAGLLRNSGNTTSLNLNTTGHNDLLRAGSKTLIYADGSTDFANEIDDSHLFTTNLTICLRSYDDEGAAQYAWGGEMYIDTGIAYDSLSDPYGSHFQAVAHGWTLEPGPAYWADSSTRFLIEVSSVQQMPVASGQSWGSMNLWLKILVRVVSPTVPSTVIDLGGGNYGVRLVNVTISTFRRT
jgi:hypothetical protein